MVKHTRRQASFRHSLRTQADDRSSLPAASSSNVAAEAAQSTESTEPVTLTAKTQRLVDDVKGDFRNWEARFLRFSEARKELAPKFMKAFLAWQSEQPEGQGTFVAWVRFLDNSVPEDRDGYRAHPAYQAAEHLKSTYNAQLVADTEPESKPRYAPATPMEALARVVATVLPMVDDGDMIWEAFKRQLHWKEAKLTRLQALVEAEKPLPLTTGRLVPKSKAA